MSVQIHPTAIIHKDTQLADGVVVGPYCIINSGVVIGEGTLLEANVIIDKDVRIGKNNHFYPNCIIGTRPQVLRLGKDDKTGGLVIGDGNVIREQVSIHSGLEEGTPTRIGNENFLMVNVHIGHDCIIEDKIVMSNCVQIAGHCKIETGAWFSGMAGSHQFVTFGKWSYASGLAGINHDVPPFLIVSGHYPPLIRGVNKRGLTRAGLNDRQQENIFDAYQKLYRKPGALLEKARALEQEDGLDKNVRAMVNAIIRSSEHQYGRYLETRRKH